jgi:uncharacterized membrane protein
MDNSSNEHKRTSLATGLGWFSLALGIAEVAMPRAIARWIGIRPQPVLLPALGLREVVSGIGILAQKRPAGWVWARVAGDAMDLALLWAAEAAEDVEEVPFRTAVGAVMGVTALDLLCAVSLSRGEGPTHVVQTITIGRSPNEVYEFWRKLENLPQVMHELQSIRQTSERRSHWIVKGPGGRRIEWDAEITDDQPNESISWRASSGDTIAHTGTVRFLPAPGDRGTIVRVEMAYDLPGGGLTRTVAKVFGQAPEQKIQLDLYRMKQIIETGVVMTTEGQPAGRASSTSKLYDWGTTRG